MLGEEHEYKLGTVSNMARPRLRVGVAGVAVRILTASQARNSDFFERQLRPVLIPTEPVHTELFDEFPQITANRVQLN